MCSQHTEKEIKKALTHEKIVNFTFNNKQIYNV